MKKLITIVAIALAACGSRSRHTYRIAVIFSDGTKDTILVKAWQDYEVWLGSKGCIETPTSVEACSVRIFKIVAKDGKPF